MNALRSKLRGLLGLVMVFLTAQSLSTTPALAVEPQLAFGRSRRFDAIERACRLILAQQAPDGSWRAHADEAEDSVMERTALCTWALIGYDGGINPSVEAATKWLDTARRSDKDHSPRSLALTSLALAEWYGTTKIAEARQQAMDALKAILDGPGQPRSVRDRIWRATALVEAHSLEVLAADSQSNRDPAHERAEFLTDAFQQLCRDVIAISSQSAFDRVISSNQAGRSLVPDDLLFATRLPLESDYDRRGMREIDDILLKEVRQAVQKPMIEPSFLNALALKTIALQVRERLQLVFPRLSTAKPRQAVAISRRSARRVRSPLHTTHAAHRFGATANPNGYQPRYGSLIDAAR